MSLSNVRRQKRDHKDSGLGFDAPKDKCSDIKCPWHGNLPVRGNVFTGSVKSSDANKTVIVMWPRYKFIKKYERYERSHSAVSAYNPSCIKARVGEKVVIAECRPLSKTKSFVVVHKITGAE